MKTIIHAVVVAVVLCLLFTVNSYAQRRTVVTIGGSWWNAGYTWEDDDGNELTKVDPGNNFGPYVSISRNRWNLGVSYLSGKYPIKSFESEGVSYDVDIDMNRSDLNISIGYRVHRLVNIFAGLKNLTWSMESTYLWSYDFLDDWGSRWTGETDATEKYTFSGPLYGGGVSCVIPLGRGGFYGFASLAGLGGTITRKEELKVEYFDYKESSEQDLSSTLVALNAGIGYRFPGGLGINAGYRGDYISTESEKVLGVSAKENVRVQGLVLTLSYTFR